MVSFPVDKEEVWKDTKDTFYDKIRGQRVVKGYGTQQSRRWQSNGSVW